MGRGTVLALANGWRLHGVRSRRPADGDTDALKRMGWSL